MLARFRERAGEVLVLELSKQPNGDWKLRDVRTMDRDAFELFGEVV